MPPSNFLIKFHREHFPNGDVSLYSKEVFYKLLEKLGSSGEK